MPHFQIPHLEVFLKTKKKGRKVPYTIQPHIKAISLHYNSLKIWDIIEAPVPT